MGNFFYQNLGIWPPAIGVTLHCFDNNFEEIPSWFVMNVCLWLLWMIKWVKLWSYLHSINIWDDLLSKYEYLTPRGYHTQGYSLLFCHSFLRNPIMLCPECICVVTLHVICIIPMGEVIFGQSLEYLTRGCPYIRLPRCFAINIIMLCPEYIFVVALYCQMDPLGIFQLQLTLGELFAYLIPKVGSFWSITPPCFCQDFGIWYLPIFMSTTILCPQYMFVVREDSLFFWGGTEIADRFWKLMICYNQCEMIFNTFYGICVKKSYDSSK